MLSVHACSASRNRFVKQVDVSANAMGTAGAKAFGDVLLVNKTVQHLNVSDNSFGKVQVGDQVKLKSSGEMCIVTQVHPEENVWTNHPTYASKGCGKGVVKWEEFEWESQVPAFCAGLAASTSLLSVSAVCAPCADDVVC